MSENEWTKILGWPGYRVYRSEIDEGAKRLRLWVRRKRGNRKLECSGCGRKFTDAYDSRERAVRDLPWTAFQATVHIEVYRVKCEECGVRIEKVPAQYQYSDGDIYHFMDTATYDQVALNGPMLADALPFMKEGQQVNLLKYEDGVIGVELPITVELAVAQTDPGLRGDTVSGATKPAKLETGATLNVPLFVNTGDVLKVDTRTGNYIERV